MLADLGQIDYLRELAAKLAQAKHGEKGTLIQAAADFLDCSVQEVYRRLASKAGVSTGRKPRRDRGKTAVPADLVRQAAGMVHVATRQNGKKTLAIKDAMEILAANGHGVVDTETGEVLPVSVSPSTLSRAMRRLNCHPEQLRAPRPSISQQSLHPNHVWQIDASVCVLFYLPRSGLQVMDQKEFYKNKPGNLARVENERVIRYVVSDHFSGAFYLEYVHGAEDAANLTHVFLNAIQRRDADDPLHGVPFNLMMDPGSANTSALFLNLLQRLGIAHLVHLPGNPQAKGQVEVTQNIVETHFESRLAFMRVADLAELNALAAKWRKVFNASAIHSRHGKTRNALWLTIRQDQLRLAPSLELCRELVTTKPVEATVRPNLTISHAVKGHGSNDYDVRFIPSVAPKQKLKVVVNPYRAPAIDVLVMGEDGRETAYTVEPLVKTDAGFYANAPIIGESYRAQAHTPIDESRQEIYRAAYDARTEQEVDAKRRAKTPAYEGAINPFADVDQVDIPTYIPKRGRDLALDAAKRELAPLTHIEAAKQLKVLLGEKWTAESFRWLTQRYPEGVPPDQVEQIAADLGGSRGAHGKPLKIIGGESC